MRKFLTALLAVGALTLVGACGTSGGSDTKTTDATTKTTDAPAKATTTTTAPTTTVAVKAWAADFCGNFSDWLDAIKAASNGVSDQVTPGDVGSARTAIAGLFASASDATRTLMTQLDEGGSPDIEDGDQLVDDLIAKFQAFDDAAQKAKTETEALPTDDLTTFQNSADDLTTRFQDEVDKVGNSFSEIDAKYPSSELNSALTDSCTF